MANILLVEDDASIREAFGIILHLNSDYKIASAENGQIALQLCEATPYDVILLDIMMPVMDGPTFLKYFRTSHPSDTAQIIIMSNLSSGSELSIVQDYGVSKCVLKSSITPQKLLSIVADAVAERSHNELGNKLSTNDSPIDGQGLIDTEQSTGDLP